MASKGDDRAAGNGREDLTTATVATATWTASTDGMATRTRRALFYQTPAGWVLDHVRETVVGQFTETTSDLDAEATATDVPAWVVRKAGLSREDLATTPGTPTTHPVATDGGPTDDHAGNDGPGEDTADDGDGGVSSGY